MVRENKGGSFEIPMKRLIPPCWQFLYFIHRIAIANNCDHCNGELPAMIEFSTKFEADNQWRHTGN